jgi:hypothetical protein
MIYRIGALEDPHGKNPPTVIQCVRDDQSGEILFMWTETFKSYGLIECRGWYPGDFYKVQLEKIKEREGE